MSCFVCVCVCMCVCVCVISAHVCLFVYTHPWVNTCVSANAQVQSGGSIAMVECVLSRLFKYAAFVYFVFGGIGCCLSLGKFPCLMHAERTTYCKVTSHKSEWSEKEEKKKRIHINEFYFHVHVFAVGDSRRFRLDSTHLWNCWERLCYNNTLSWTSSILYVYICLHSRYAWVAEDLYIYNLKTSICYGKQIAARI